MLKEGEGVRSRGRRKGEGRYEYVRKRTDGKARRRKCGEQGIEVRKKVGKQ